MTKYVCNGCGEKISEMEGVNCNDCQDELSIEISNWNKDNIVEGISDKRKAQWMQNVFESQQIEYLECGYLDESFKEFLENTYESTNISFPNTIFQELNL